MDPTTLHQALAYKLGHRRASRGWLPEQAIWLWCVDRERERALLLAFDPSGGKPLLTKDVTEGALIHPSGLHFDGTWLWNALAGYTRAGPTKVQRLDPKTLEVTAAFQVSDHIGTISSDGEGTLHGFNWDALQMYVWRQDGTLLRKVDNPTGYAFQDCEIAVGKLWCCGIHKPTDSSAVLVMDPTNLAVKRTLPVPRATARRHGCHEGMTVEKDRLLLAPLFALLESGTFGLFPPPPFPLLDV